MYFQWNDPNTALTTPFNRLWEFVAVNSSHYASSRQPLGMGYWKTRCYCGWKFSHANF